jgi:hypothetical protein
MNELLKSNGLIAIGIDSKTDKIKYTLDLANDIAKNENVLYLNSFEKDNALKNILQNNEFNKSPNLYIDIKFLYFTLSSVVSLIESIEFYKCSTIFIDSIDSYIKNIEDISCCKNNCEEFTQENLIKMLKFVSEKYSVRIVFISHLYYGIHLWKTRQNNLKQSNFIKQICNQTIIFNNNKINTLNN